MKKISLLTIISCLLINCTSSMLAPTPSPKVNTYTLSDIKVPVFRPLKGILLIRKPDVSSELRGSAMLYSTKLHQLDAYSLNKWVTTPANLLHNLLLTAFEDTHAYKAIVKTSYMIKPKWQLNIRINDFYQNYLTNPSTMIISLHVDVVSLEKNKIIGKRTFNREKKVTKNSAYGGVLTANDIMQEMVPKLITFVRNTTSKY